MVLPIPAAHELESCRFLLQGQAKILADRLYGSDGPTVGTSFDEIETVTGAVSLEFRKRLLDLLMARQAEAMHRHLPEELRLCPSCGQETIAKDPEPRVLHGRGVTVEWMEPQRYCGHCRRAFFPQSKSLGIDLGHYSVSLLNVISYAGANKVSFREASKDLQMMAGEAVKEKQVERLTKRIGQERLAERDAEVERFVGLPLVQRCEQAPADVEPLGDKQVAVVMADAGMLQLRAAPVESGDLEKALSSAAGILEKDDLEPAEEGDDDDQDKPPSGRHWREDKVGLVMTMQSEVSESDPCPEIPETFVDLQRVSRIVRGLKKSAALRAEEESVSGSSTGQTLEEQTDEALEEIEYKGPKLEKRRVVASRQSWPVFGVILACAAWMAGYAKAKRKAFVADGARSIWRVWQSRFSSYVPILDFIHALSYVYAAAKAVGQDEGEGWRLYVEWIRWVWGGHVALVIERLRQWQEQHGKPEKGESETSLRSVVAKSLRYLTNNQGKMKYAEYRKQGLPLVSSLVESMVKQISRRVKGTEKFWSDEGAEAIIQLRADYLSDGDIMTNFWKRRQAAANGQRHYRCNNSAA
jgi:hypothetical protein